MKKKRVLLLSCSVILLCMCVVAGMSYALFTDSKSVGNHLKAGNLDVTLTRTGLRYNVLNEEGQLQLHTNGTPLNLTGTTFEDDNVFGIDSDDIRIVPGSFFEATLTVTNSGSTALTYNVDIKLNGEATALAQQLKVTVTQGTTTNSAMFSTLTENGLTAATGSLNPNSVQEFTVCVEFVEDSNNNAAQMKAAAFDLQVTAEQATAAE